MFVEFLVIICIFVGLFFCSVGVLGLYRLPDVYTKQHSTGLVDTVGIFFICLGLSIYSGFVLVSFKPIILAILVGGFSSPICYAFIQIAFNRDKVNKDQVKRGN